MRITYDKSADAAYIYLTDIPAGGVASTHPLEDFEEVSDMINLDFDKDKRLLGIEVLSASTQLPKDVLDSAQIID
jgi:uncharacterized protein YuzE